MKYMVKEPGQVVPNIPNEKISFVECTHRRTEWRLSNIIANNKDKIIHKMAFIELALNL